MAEGPWHAAGQRARPRFQRDTLIMGEKQRRTAADPPPRGGRTSRPSFRPIVLRVGERRDEPVGPQGSVAGGRSEAKSCRRALPVPSRLALRHGRFAPGSG
jgi:hypothetical protein